MSSVRRLNIFTMLQKMDDYITNFYSAKSSGEKNVSEDQCQCIRQKDSKMEELQYYNNQKYLILQTFSNLNKEKQEDQQSAVLKKFLNFMIQYIQKILHLLQQQYLCDCKIKILGDSIINNHKIDFLREENDKIFQLLSEKVDECQLLKQEIFTLELKIQDKQSSLKKEQVQEKIDVSEQQHSKKQISCLLPLSLRNRACQKSNISGFSEFVDSQNLSQCLQKAKQINKSLIHYSHKKYFNDNQNKCRAIKRQKKSRIFNEK